MYYIVDLYVQAKTIEWYRHANKLGAMQHTSNLRPMLSDEGQYFSGVPNRHRG